MSDDEWGDFGVEVRTTEREFWIMLFSFLVAAVLVMGVLAWLI
jgi:high-affinity Fe2+/Pb2+ permease